MRLPKRNFALYDSISSPRAMLMIAIATLGLSITLISQGFLYSGFILPFGFAFLYPYHCILMWIRFEKFCYRHRQSPAFIAALIVAFGVAVSMLFGFTDPASAQFFNKTETWMNSAIPGMTDNTLVKLIFNVLRAIFVIYLGIALVKVIQAAREGEEWKSLATQPVIVFFTSTLGDVLAGIITGAK